MSIKSDLAAQIVAGIDDIRCYGATVLLDGIFERTDPVGDIPRFRVSLIPDNKDDPLTYIEDMDALKALIVEDNLTIIHTPRGVNNAFIDKCKPVLVRLEGVQVLLTPEHEEDSYYIGYANADKVNILFRLCYVADGDDALPMKIIEVQLREIRT